MNSLEGEDSKQLYWLAFGVFAATMITRLPLAVYAPVISPDGNATILVAKNIFLNACISLSDPLTAACRPHWGGNHLPGYPLFVGLVRQLFSHDAGAVTVTQTILVALSGSWLVVALGRLILCPGIAFGAVLVTVLSPVQIAWVRFVLPDALFVATTLWLFAELCRSLSGRKLKIISVGLALLAACMLRYDAVVLAVPVAIVGLHLHDTRIALLRGFLVFLIVAVPVSGFLVRNVSQGLALLPNPFMPDGYETPQGYLDWGNTWITNLTQGGDMAYPIISFQYKQINIDPVAYSNEAEREKVEELIRQLRNYEGEGFPIEIDEGFSRLAAKKRLGEPLRHYLVVPMKRMASFWLSPTASFGWPLEIRASLTKEQAHLMTSGKLLERVDVALQYPLISFGKAIVFFYRIILVVAAGVLVVSVITSQMAPNRILLSSALAYAFSRTLVLSYQPSIDNRYMISAMVVVELAGAIGVLTCLARHRQAR
jgi:hypothetical protein